MKKYISILLLILMFFSLTACESKKIEPDNTINTAEETSKIQQIVETKESSSNDKTEFELTDKSYDDLTLDEKEQLKYYNDGYTFIANFWNNMWYVYKYGELFKVIDTTNLRDELPELYEENINFDNYLVIDNCLYFFVRKTNDVFKIDFDILKVEKYISGEEFKDYTTVDNCVMLKHNKNLFFVLTCAEWNNIIEIDTTKDTPTLDYKGKGDNLVKPGDVFEKFEFIPIDSNNYRVTEAINNISYNYSLENYMITEKCEFPNIGYDEDNWQDYLHEKTIGYFYREGKDYNYSFISKTRENELNGKEEHSSEILKADSKKNKSILAEKLPFFNFEDTYTDTTIKRLSCSKLSNEWLYFVADYQRGNNNLIYFFDDNLLCDTSSLNYTIEYVDLWNVYYMDSKEENYILYYYIQAKPINDFKSSIYMGEE